MNYLPWLVPLKTPPLPTGFWKQMLPAIGKPLLNLINASLTSWYVRQPFKIAVIKPILKKPNLDPLPISNLPFPSKILEKEVAKQICSFLQSNSTLFQSRFRPHHSTETALPKGLNNLLLSSDFIALLVLRDVSVAFDTIDHLILIDWLENLVGLSVQALSWFKSCLSERCQFVYTANEPSYRSRVRYGIPKGSVLFSLYILPLGNIVRNHGINFHCYADDTQLYLSAKPDTIAKLSNMEACFLKDTKECLAHNFLLLNSGKTEILVVSHQSPSETKFLTLHYTLIVSLWLRVQSSKTLVSLLILSSLLKLI